MNIQNFKSHFYSGNEFVHFNNAGQCLIPDVNRDTMIHWMNRFYNEAALTFPDAIATIEVTRKKLAQFIGAQPEEIAFMQTTATAISQAAFGISLKSGDEVLTWDQEYPSNFYPWRVAAERANAKVIQIESVNWQTPVEKLLERVTKNTKVVAVSWVQYQTGAVTDLKKLSQALKGKGIWLVADIIQGAGIMPFHFRDSGVDIACCGSYKWLCSAFGASFMVVRQERIEELMPIQVGAMSFGTPDTPKTFANPMKATAERFEPGSKCTPEIIALGATIDLFTKYGINNIEQEAARLADRLRNGLSEKGFLIHSPAGPFVNFAPKNPKDTDACAEKLMNANISHANKRGPGIRLSVHAYNRESEVDRVLEVL